MTRGKFALIAAAIVIGGMGLGYGLERTGSVSLVSESVLAAPLAEVPYSACPGSPPLGDLHRGDRVYVTGRTDDGEWAEIRAPYDLGGRVWVRSRWLVPDSPLLEASVVIAVCPDDGLESGGAAATTSTAVTTSTTTTTSTTSTTSPATSTTSPTTSTTSSGTTTSGPSTTTTAATTTTTTTPPTTTTSGPSTTTTAATTTTTTTTAPADQLGPSVGFLQSTEPDLWENANYGGCPTQPQTAAVSAVVADPSGVASVQLSWSVGSAAGSAGMSEIAPGVYSVTVGPFGETTLSAGTAPIALQLIATDALSNLTTVASESLILLHNCAIG